MKTIFKNKKTGFTIVELIVVMAIIAILILIAIPTLSKYINNANKTSELATSSTIYKSTVTAVLTESLSTTYTTFTTPTSSKPYAEIPSTSSVVKRIDEGVDGNTTFKVYAYNPLDPMLPRINSNDWEVFVKVSNNRVDPTGAIYFFAPGTNNKYVNGKLQ